MDKYDRHIEELRKYPERMLLDWERCFGLFALAKKDGCPDDNCGCLTTIRRHKDLCVSGRPDLTEKIKNDERIPNSVNHITVESLPVFAEWQRILDKELGRK